MAHGKNRAGLLMIGFVSVMLLISYSFPIDGKSAVKSNSNNYVKVIINKIIDGDSLVVRGPDTYLQIRLWGIDAPGI